MTIYVDKEARAGFKRGLVSTIISDNQLTREQLLGRLLGFFEDCLAELVDEGQLSVMLAATGESHMDMFTAHRRH